MVGAYPPAPRLDRPVAPHARAPPIEKYGFPQKLYGYITLDRLRAHDYFQPMTPGLFTPIVVARFWNKVNKGSPTECWPWTGQKNKKKKHGKVKIYGRFDVADRSFAAHRIAVWLSGSIIDGLQVNHACGNSLCCNPNPGHAYAGTHQENMADGRRLGEFAKGIDHGQAKLTPDLVEFIRATSARVLARTLGVSKSLIDAVRHDHIWKPEE